MRNIKLFIILTLFFGISACTTPLETEKLIIGEWILVAEVDALDDMEPLEIPDLPSNDGAGEALKTTITFNKDRTIFINQKGNEYDSTYELTDSILTLGFREYIVIKIDKNKLIYKDRDGLFNKQYEFKKAQ